MKPFKGVSIARVRFLSVDQRRADAFPVLIGVESITILVDHDLSGTGQQAALRCSVRWTSAGREVFRLVPRQPGADVNDLLKCGGATS